jgi:hypothetical protein
MTEELVWFDKLMKTLGIMIRDLRFCGFAPSTLHSTTQKTPDYLGIVFVLMAEEDILNKWPLWL